VRFEYWRCADTTYAVPRLSSLRLVGLSKRSCRAKLPFDTVNPLSSFALPSAPDGRPRWGGDLYVAWTLDQYGPGSRPLQGWETETAVLHLSGRADGCPELTGR
jgi:hypothetical protein